MKVVNDFEQNSDEWFQFRLGKLTGSRLASIWSSRPYTVTDIELLLKRRGFDMVKFQAKLNEQRKKRGEKAKKYTKADLEKILTEDDVAQLSSDSEKKLEFYQVLADQFAITPQDDEIQYRDAMERGHELEDEAAMAFAAEFKVELDVIGCVVSEADDRIINSPDRYVKPAKGKGYTEAVEVKCLSAAKHLMCYFERKIPEEYFTQKVQYFVTNESLDKTYWVFYNPRLPILPLFFIEVRKEDVGHWPETMTKYQLRTLNEIDALKERLIAEADVIHLRAKPEKGITA